MRRSGAPSGAARTEVREDRRKLAIGSLRGLAQRAPCRLRLGTAALAARCRQRRLGRKGLRSFPGLAHRMRGAGRPPRSRVVRQRLQGHHTADAAAGHAPVDSFADIFWIAGGKPKKAGGDHRTSRNTFPRIRKAYLIGGSRRRRFAGTLGASAPHEISCRRSMSRSSTPHARCGGVRIEGSGGATVARPVHRSTSIATSRSAAQNSAISSVGAAGA